MQAPHGAKAGPNDKSITHRWRRTVLEIGTSGQEGVTWDCPRNRSWGAPVLLPAGRWEQEAAVLPSPQHPHRSPKVPTGAASRGTGDGNLGAGRHLWGKRWREVAELWGPRAAPHGYARCRGCAMEDWQSPAGSGQERGHPPGSPCRLLTKPLPPQPADRVSAFTYVGCSQRESGVPCTGGAVQSPFPLQQDPLTPTPAHPPSSACSVLPKTLTPRFPFPAGERVAGG